MLEAHADWMPLGSADEQKPAAGGRSRPGAVTPETGTLVRHQEGLRGRFAMYVPPVLEALGQWNWSTPEEQPHLRK